MFKKAKKEEEVKAPVMTEMQERQAFLLNLIDTMKENGFKDMSNIEHALSVVNQRVANGE